MVSTPFRTAVVGGGVLGVSTATQLVRAGADVVLMTEGELTSNASGRSLSWLNSAGCAPTRTTGCGWPASTGTARWPRTTR